MGGVLFVNPRSGGRRSSAVELASAARRLGISVHVLADDEDVKQLALESDADVLGMAGGDGSLGVVAGVAVERDLPFVCVPFGTRNHFAADAGVDPDPVRALEAFGSARERRVDVGRVGDRVFVNNVSLGVYARLVYRRESRRRRDQAFARLRALAQSLRDHRYSERFVIDGAAVRASIVIVANNGYKLDLFALGERERLDEGSVHVFVAHGLRRLRWRERKAKQVSIDTRGPRTRAAVDGEPAVLPSPVVLRTDPLALRLRVLES